MGNSSVKIDISPQLQQSILLPTNINVLRDYERLKDISNKIKNIINEEPHYFAFAEEDVYGWCILSDNLALDIYDYITKKEKNKLSDNAINIINEVIIDLFPKEQKIQNNTVVQKKDILVSGGALSSNIMLNIIKHNKRFIDLFNDYINNI